jgi:predicted double-glycine peptidase
LAVRALSLRVLIAGCAILGSSLSATPSVAQIDIGSGLRVDAAARSMKDLRDQNVVRQRYDFSCGAAALATILHYGFGDSVSERQLLQDLFDVLSEDEREIVRSEGFSLLHLQRVAQARNYNADGFRLTPGQLSLLGGPVIVYIEPYGYPHFAVLRGIRRDRVYLADPSRGNIRMPMYQFLDSWLQEEGTGIIFAVEPATGLPGERSQLPVAGESFAPPEVMTALEMLAVGSFVGRLLHE